MSRPDMVVTSESQRGAPCATPCATGGIVPLPHDCTLLPLASGALLVSRDHAVFCHIPPLEVDAVRALVAGEATLDALTPTLAGGLSQHGFFDPPRQAKPDSPSVQIQLTNACDLACSYCCTNSASPRAREVRLHEMLEVARQIPEVVGDNASVALLGGEPFLVPWAIELATEIAQMGLPLTIFTDGLLLTQAALARDVARLTQGGVQVRVSLGGPSAATCDAVSGAERFATVLRGLHELAAFGGQATVDLMFMPQDAEAACRELPRLQELLPADTPVALGVLYRSGRETGDHLFPSRAELEAALDRVTFDAGVCIPAPRTSRVADRRDGCGCALGHHIHVRSDGALFNCFKMEEQVGHLDVEGFAATARSVREHPHRATELTTCRDCPLATICGAGCRAENLLYTGDADDPPCGPWRVRVLSELLAEGRVTAVEWSLAFLLQEARRRGIETPGHLMPRQVSRHLVDT